MPAEISGRLGRARFLRLGWYRAPATATPSTQPYLTIAGTNASDYVSSAVMTLAAELKDTTGITSSAKTYQSLQDETGELQIEGPDQPALQALIDAATTFAFYPQGTATGKPYYAGSACIASKRDTKTSDDDANRASVTLTGTTSRGTV